MYKYKYLIVGKSGSGKSSIVDRYCKKYGTTQVLSLTTRPIRACESDNMTHTHVSKEEFKSLLNDLVAYDEYNGNQYGATKQQVLDSDFYIINQKGVEYINKKMPELKYKVVFIDVKDNILTERMLARGDSLEQIKERLEADKLWREQISPILDIGIGNNRTIDDAVETLHAYIDVVEKGK